MWTTVKNNNIKILYLEKRLTKLFMESIYILCHSFKLDNSNIGCRFHNSITIAVFLESKMFKFIT